MRYGVKVMYDNSRTIVSSYFVQFCNCTWRLEKCLTSGHSGLSLLLHVPGVHIHVRVVAVIRHDFNVVV